MGKIIIIENVLRINPDVQDGGWYVEEGRILEKDSTPDKSGKYNKKGDVIWEIANAGYCTSRIKALNRCLDYKLARMPDMLLEEFLKENSKEQNKLLKYLEIEEV